MKPENIKFIKTKWFAVLSLIIIITLSVSLLFVKSGRVDRVIDKVNQTCAGYCEGIGKTCTGIFLYNTTCLFQCDNGVPFECIFIGG